MSLNKKINPTFIHTINFHHNDNGKSLAGSLQSKVVKIQGSNDLNHPSMREAVNFITREEFSKNFLKAGKTFVINVIVNGSLIPLDVQQLTSLQCFKDRPIIFYFENLKGDFCTYYKDKKSKNFKYLSKVTEISMENFLNSKFTFELLLRALKSKFCGSFDGKFSETKINLDPLIEDYRLIDLAVMGNDVLCVRFLQLFENCLEDLGAQSLRLLQHAARSCDEEGFLGIFDLNFDTKEVKSKINLDLLSVRDPSGYNLLMIASEHSNTSGVMFLLNLSFFDVNYEVEGVTAASLSSSPEILLMLLQNDSKYPKNFINRQQSEELQDFTLKISELHQSIHNGDYKNAKEILYNFRLRYFFNTCNKSAAYAAIECKKFKIYELLLMNDSTIAPYENIEDIPLDEVSKNYLKILHDKYKSPLYTKCVLDVEKKVKCINVSEINRRKFQFELRNALNILHDIEVFQPVLQITAACDVDITMDFERNSVNFMDPSEVNSTRGYFGNNTVLIGAKDLFNDDLKNLFLATLIHELTHFVMNFLYSNQCRPYLEMDLKRANDFKIIHKLCRKGGEKLIEAVYGYHESLQHSELIVRPNHLIALYYDNENMRRECEENYEELFKFYKERIYVDMRNALEWIESDKRRSFGRLERNKKRKYAEIYESVKFKDDQKYFNQPSPPCKSLSSPLLIPQKEKSSSKLKLKKLTFFLFLAIILLTFLTLILSQKPNLPQTSRLTSSPCINFTHSLTELIENKNYSLYDILEENQELWWVESDCNVLQKSIELHGDDEFVDDLLEVAESAFKNCEGKFKRLLINAGENLANFRIKKKLNDKLTKLLSADEYREYLSGNFDKIGRDC